MLERSGSSTPSVLGNVFGSSTFGRVLFSKPWPQRAASPILHVLAIREAVCRVASVPAGATKAAAAGHLELSNRSGGAA
jgi:hypothetical protein